MPERDSGQEDHFNLLPFIAILLCVLGTELLVTMSMATISLGVGAVEGWVQDKDPAHATKNPTLIEWDGKEATVNVKLDVRPASNDVASASNDEGVLNGVLHELVQGHGQRRGDLGAHLSRLA